MSLNIYISTKDSPVGSIVISKVNPTPTPFRSLVLGNTLDTNIYLVDGVGGFNAISGDAAYSVAVGIGMPGDGAAWLNTTWTPITNGWNGNLATTAAAIGALFTSLGLNPIEPTLEIRVTDAQSRIVSETLTPIKIFRRVIDPENLVNPPSPSNSDGEYAIPNLADSGSVTGLNLAAVPRRVLATVRKPAGGETLFASIVAGTISTAGFSFTLSGVTDDTTYKLDYLLIF